jgi:hypothetical protein
MKLSRKELKMKKRNFRSKRRRKREKELKVKMDISNFDNPKVVSPITIDGSGDIARVINQTGVVPSTETKMFGCEIEKSFPNYVRDFADEKGLGEFIRVPIRTKGLTGSGYSFKCHFNVAGLVSWKGGKVLKGYSVFQYEMGHTEFSFHSVWITPEGDAVCVSNNYDERKDIEKDFDNILFIPIGIGQIDELGVFPNSTMFEPFWKQEGYWNKKKQKVFSSSNPIIERRKIINDIYIHKMNWLDAVERCNFHDKSLGSGKSWSEIKREQKLGIVA